MEKDIKHKIFPFLLWWPKVNKKSLRADILAGLTNAVVVLPQGVAFSMIAGLPPEYGLYTAMVVPIIAALFGSSWHLVSGPTTPISIVVFSVLSQYEVPGTESFIGLAFVLTFLAGIFQLLLGFARLGSLVNFVSHSVVVGFTAGAALLIASSQLKHVFGIDIPDGISFTEQFSFLFAHIAEINYPIFIVALFTIIVAVGIKKFLPKWPNMLLAMIAGSVLAYFLPNNSEIELVGLFDAVLPRFSTPDLKLDTIIDLTPNAFALALLGLIEAVAIARSIAIHSHQKLDGNQEFIGQGLSNIVGSFFMSYAGSGSFTRSGLNYQSGAKTPLSAVFAAISLGLILVFVKDLTAYIPIASMGGIIMVVAYRLIDFKFIIKTIKHSKRELSVLIVTLLATLFLHLEYAIYIGVIYSLLVHLQKLSKPRIVNVAPQATLESRHFQSVELEELDECPQLPIIQVYGSLFFGAIDHLSKVLEKIKENENPRVLIVSNSINLIDIAGAEFLVSEAKQFEKLNGKLYLSGLNTNARNYFKKSGYLKEFGEERIFGNKESAIENITKELDMERCRYCKSRIFRECEKFPK